MRGNWVWASAALLVACGGRIDIGDDGGPPPAPGASSEDAGTASGGNPSGQNSSGFDICPPDPPEVGTACSVSYACAYPITASPSTCQRFTCDAAGHWQGMSGGC